MSASGLRISSFHTTQGVYFSGISQTKQEPERKSASPNSPASNRKPNMAACMHSLDSTKPGHLWQIAPCPVLEQSTCSPLRWGTRSIQSSDQRESCRVIATVPSSFLSRCPIDSCVLIMQHLCNYSRGGGLLPSVSQQPTSVQHNTGTLSTCIKHHQHPAVYLESFVV